MRFPTDWLDIEIQMRVRRRLLSKPHTVKEALDCTRAQELAAKQAKRIKMDQQSRETNLKEQLFKVGPTRQNKPPISK